MIIYQAQKSQFLHDVHHRDIEEVIVEAFRARTGHKVGEAEIKAWANSLGYMGKVMADEAIPADCGVAIEYTIPQTSLPKVRRVDFLITGKNAERLQKAPLFLKGERGQRRKVVGRIDSAFCSATQE